MDNNKHMPLDAGLKRIAHVLEEAGVTAVAEVACKKGGHCTTQHTLTSPTSSAAFSVHEKQCLVGGRSRSLKHISHEN